MSAPRFTVVMPVLDGGSVFERCLEALFRSSFRDWDLVVVDDGSSDGSLEVARRRDARVLATRGRRGPAEARNLGAAVARGEFLLFLDADCEVHPDTLERAARRLDAAPEVDALFGSYDLSPAAPGVVSQFKNLLHHFVHQHGDEEAVTFWAGCGAVRRATFLRLGGFDARRFPRPSIEDIELGYRLTAAGGRILLAKDVQVRHHKRWTLAGLIRTDVRDRGLPWTELLLERRRPARELNVDLKGRLSVLLLVVAVAAAAAALALASKAWSLVAVTAVLGLLVLNRAVYRFFLRQRGPAFALASVLLH
ncbi:MAG: glycosyltransferase, partial [Acidobacteriota bacterium]|nr:glycosyltransferase [Acidobacteriota bacterium]